MGIMVVGACLAGTGRATSCIDLGLIPDTASVLLLREAAQQEQPAMTYRDLDRRAWFLPLKGLPSGRSRCDLDQTVFWKIEAGDDALQYNSDSGLLTFLDMRRATSLLDGRIATVASTITALDSAGINYQLALNYYGAKLNPSAFGDFYAYNGGWYFDTRLAWNNNGRLARYESYALRQSVDTGTFLRLGDAVTGPTALGESLQFAGVAWGNDRTLRPADFAPVLPTLRSGNVLAGPLEVFINDTLQFQQTLQGGVYDLRNIPAQQGFNSYTVRTLDAQGNPVTVQREIYLPATLLPAGTRSWRIDAGFQREDFFTSSSKYGAPLVGGSYAAGLGDDTTVGGQALISRRASTASVTYDRRLTAIWSGHLGLLAGKAATRRGSAMQAGLEGGGRSWRLLADWTQAFRALPGLGDRPALIMQRLIRAQWNGLSGVSLGTTLAQSKREGNASENVASLTASTRVSESGAVITAALIDTRAGQQKQTNLTLSLILPLTPRDDQRSHTLYASQNSVNGVQLSRLQYNNNGPAPQDGNWGLGITRDSRQALTSLDAGWSRTTEKFELDANAMTGANQSVQVAMRSGLVWAGDTLFITRPVAGAFALVNTQQKEVPVYYENRLAGNTNERGLLLIPQLIPNGINRIRLDPATWPMYWTASEVEKHVVPPLGGGVLVSFKINVLDMPGLSFLKPVQANGNRFPLGTLVTALFEGSVLDTVIDREGQLWVGDLMPATGFSITYKGIHCDFRLQAVGNSGEAPEVFPVHCREQP